MESIGNTLREARRGKGLSLKELEEMTKIRVHYLRALEEENFNALPGKTYVQGFIRTYAKALGLNPQELSDAYKAAVITPEQVIKPIEPLAPAVTKSTPSIPRGLVIAGLCLLALLTLFGVDSVWKKTSPPAAEPATKTPAVSNMPQTPPQPQPQPQQTNPVTQETKELTLDMNFVADCWLIVKADGQKVFEGKFSSGQTKNIKANENIELVTVGNAGGLKLVLNGKALSPLGEMGQVIRNKVLTIRDITQ